MYKYNLIISIFSSNKELEELIKTTKSVDKFIIDIKKYNKVDTKVISESDIIIWDLDDDLLKYKLKEDAKVIICATSYDSKYQNNATVLIKPVDVDFIKITLDKVIKEKETEEDLNFSNICLTTAVDALPDMFWIKTLDGIHTVLNNEFCNVVKKSKEDVTGKDHYYIWDVSKDDPNSGADLCKQTEDEVIKAGHLLSFQETVKIDTGIRQLVTYKAPLYDKYNKAVGTVGIGHDITDLKNLSIEMNVLLKSMPYPVLLRDDKKIILDINPAFEKVFGVDKNAIIGEDYDEWSANTFHDGRTINSEGFREASLTVNGEEKIVELRFDDIKDVFDNITGQVCIYRDVTTQRKLEEQIIKNSNIDFMTKLYNRRYLYSFISEQGDGATITLLLLDLDHFKSINDTYGHKLGDEAIILTSNTLKTCFKDDIVVRMGGDEFLVVKVGSYSLDDVCNSAEKAIDILHSSFQKKKEFKNLSASIGIAQGSLEEGIDNLINNADRAMYESKQNGRSCYTIFE